MPRDYLPAKTDRRLLKRDCGPWRGPVPGGDIAAHPSATDAVALPHRESATRFCACPLSHQPRSAGLTSGHAKGFAGVVEISPGSDADTGEHTPACAASLRTRMRPKRRDAGQNWPAGGIGGSVAPSNPRDPGARRQGRPENWSRMGRPRARNRQARWEIDDGRCHRRTAVGNRMNQRIESFLTDVLALAGESLDAVREGVRVALADCQAIFRAEEPKPRMRDQAAHACRALCRTRVAEELLRRKGTQIAEHLTLVLSIIDRQAH